eukprot:GHRR01009704.1.p1 GENE.GHRR01009704.1~~GHRR01009704.1.p1  ORF type:complete len:178 (-),score=49.63 GHRR01009704.1:542-1075(-)
MQASQEEIVAQVDKDLRTMLLKPDAAQPRVVGVRVWPRAIPQFNIGHLDTLDKAKQVSVMEPVDSTYMRLHRANSSRLMQVVPFKALTGAMGVTAHAVGQMVLGTPRCRSLILIAGLTATLSVPQGLHAAGLDGILLGGNYVAGVALGRCVEYGYEFADQVSKYVANVAVKPTKVAA